MEWLPTASARPAAVAWRCASSRSTEPERPVCASCGLVVYLDPKVAVGTIIRTADGQIVLVRRAIEPGYGLWVFPGGYVDRGEEVTRPRLGKRARSPGSTSASTLLNIYSYGGRAPIIIVYTATALGGELCGDDECLETRLFPADEIPWDSLAFRSTIEALQDYFKIERMSSELK